MKTLHFNASGEYTGYSVNKSSIIEIIFNAIITAASVTGSVISLYSAGKQVSDAVNTAKKESTDTTDPK